MHQSLLDILICPLCKGKLIFNQIDQELICHFDQLAYPIRQQIPVMLTKEARDLSVLEKK